jgi:uncharacterized membrane protein
VSVLAALLPGTQHLQNAHPLLVHFPVALLPAATLLYAAAWLTGRPALGWGAYWALVLGTLGAAAAVASGLWAEEGVMVDPSVRAALLEPHEDIMLSTLGLAVALAAWATWAPPFPSRGRMLFVVLVVVLAGVLTKGADYGGRMVYDYNAGGSACGQPIPFTP